MNRPVIVGVIIAILIAVFGYFLFFADNNDEDVTTVPETTQTTPTEEEGETVPINETEQTDTEAVTIANRAFTPASITVAKGTTVTWTNDDTQQHDVTPDQETSEFVQSNMLSNGDTYSVTFNTPGTYTYHCSPHPDMTGTIIVTE